MLGSRTQEMRASSVRSSVLNPRYAWSFATLGRDEIATGHAGRALTMPRTAGLTSLLASSPVRTPIRRHRKGYRVLPSQNNWDAS